MVEVYESLGMTKDRAADLMIQVVDMMEDDDKYLVYSDVLVGIASIPGITLVEAAYAGGVSNHCMTYSPEAIRREAEKLKEQEETT